MFHCHTSVPGCMLFVENTVCNHYIWKTKANNIWIITSNFFHAGIPLFPWILFNRCKHINHVERLCLVQIRSSTFLEVQKGHEYWWKHWRSPQQHPSVISRSMKVYNKAGRLTTSNNHLLVALFQWSAAGVMAGYLPKTPIKAGSSWTRWVHVYFLRHMYYIVVSWHNSMVNQTKGTLQLQTTP